MRYLRPSVVVLSALALLVSATAALAAGATGGGTKVAVAQTGLGRILVDGRGHTLYLFEKDTRGKSTCAGQCAGFWPPLITSAKPLALKGARASLLGTTRRADGRLQVTYNRHPLYTFVKDGKKGSTKGEGFEAFGAEWYAVSAQGTNVEQKPASSGGGTSSGSNSGSSSGYGSSSGGYGY